MASRPNTPIPQDRIGESFVWRDWFQRLSDRVFGTLGTQDASAVDISGGVISNTAITGGSINGTIIGNTTPAAASFTAIVLGSPLPTSYGGTGVTTATANYVLAGPTSGGAVAPSFRALVVADIPSLPYVSLSAPVTKTADFTLATGETWIINNKAASACIVTFPAASLWTGRQVTIKNMQAFAVNSASSNVVPLDSTTAGTAILLGVVGNWAALVSDGTNWVVMQAASNNTLLLE